MPELPEVETTCRGVEPHVTKQSIAQVHVYQPSLRWPIPQAVESLAGLRIERVFRRAKYLIFQKRAFFFGLIDIYRPSTW